MYSRLMEAIGRPDMGASNPLYATNSGRCEHVDAIMGEWDEHVPGTEASVCVSCSLGYVGMTGSQGGAGRAARRLVSPVSGRRPDQTWFRYTKKYEDQLMCVIGASVGR